MGRALKKKLSDRATNISILWQRLYGYVHVDIVCSHSAFVNSHCGGMHALHIDTFVICIVPQEEKLLFRDISVKCRR